jgi:hypothetical protein
MATELRKVGAEVEEGEDYIRVTPPAQIQYAEIGTYNDHRMAMCFSLVALSDTLSPSSIRNARPKPSLTTSSNWRVSVRWADSFPQPDADICRRCCFFTLLPSPLNAIFCASTYFKLMIYMYFIYSING